MGLPESKGFLYLPSYAESDYENIPKKENDTFDLVFAGNIGAVSGEVEKVISDADCGACCKSLDYKSLADLILMASKSDKIDKWSDNAYNYYKKNFDKEKCMDELENLLKLFGKK